MILLLQELLHNRKLYPSGADEREHIINILLEAGGSTGDSCSICLDSYESGEVLRPLSCGHKFYIHQDLRKLSTHRLKVYMPTCSNLQPHLEEYS